MPIIITLNLSFYQYALLVEAVKRWEMATADLPPGKEQKSNDMKIEDAKRALR